MEQKRVFVGVVISDEACESVCSYLDGLRAQFPFARARWLHRESLHITLKFVGNASLNELASLDQRVSRAAARHEPFEATLQRTGSFTQRKIRSDALWIGIPSGPLTKIGQDLADAWARPFIPHLTIARLKDAGERRAIVNAHLLSTFGPVPFSVDELLIYESTLTPTGSVYNVLSRHRLGTRV